MFVLAHVKNISAVVLYFYTYCDTLDNRYPRWWIDEYNACYSLMCALNRGQHEFAPLRNIRLINLEENICHVLKIHFLRVKNVVLLHPRIYHVMYFVCIYIFCKIFNANIVRGLCQCDIICWRMNYADFNNINVHRKREALWIVLFIFLGSVYARGFTVKIQLSVSMSLW